MNKLTTSNKYVLTLVFIIAVLGLTSSTQMTDGRVNFQSYCWPILGDRDTTLIYQYQMSSVEYDTVWNRYFEIEAHSEGESRYFNYTVYDKEFQPEAHYRYALDHKGIRLLAMNVKNKDSKLMPGTIEHQRMFEWELHKGNKHTSTMTFFNLHGDSTNLTIASSTQYEGISKKIIFGGEKVPSIQFYRKVVRHSKDFDSVSEGVSYYAKGIGYFKSHIVYNGNMKFDEVLTNIYSSAQWDVLRK